MINDFDKIMAEYDDLSDDFGFSTVSEAEYNKAITETEDTAQSYKNKLKEVEKLILPFLQKLYKTADQEYIYWPNRKLILERQIERIIKLTR